LIINVVEKPILRSIKILGTKEYLKVRSILLKSKLLEGDYYDLAKFKVFVSRLRSYYLSKGYYHLTIDVNFNYDDYNHFIDVKIDLSLNSLLYVRDINIVGNKSFSNRKLLSIMSHSVRNWITWFTRNNVFIKSRLTSDLKKIKSVYVDNGFVDFRLNFIKVFFLNNKKEVSIFIDLHEGDIHKYGFVKMQGKYSRKKQIGANRIIDSNLKHGELFSFVDLIRTKDKLRLFFRRVGFGDPTINFNVSDVHKNGYVDVIFDLPSLKRIMVKRISFDGNYMTADHVLRNLVPQIEDSWVSLDDVNFGRSEILRKGFAKKVEIDFVKRLNSKEEYDLVYRIKEHSMNKFIAGCSYTHGDNFILHINSELSNFLGSGRDLAFNINKGKKHSDYIFNFLHSNFFGKQFDVTYNFSLRRESFNKRGAHFDHASDIFGASVSYNSRISKHQYLALGFGYDKTILKLVEERAPIEVKYFLFLVGRKYKEYYFTSNYVYNSLDVPVFPKEGIIKHLNVRIALPWSKIRYFYINYDSTFYKKLYKKHILGVYYNISYGNTYFTKVPFPFFKNFFLRGANHVRGFKERSLGPRDSNNDIFGGNFLFCCKISFYFPFPYVLNTNNVRTSLFFDAGQVFNTNHFYNGPRVRARFFRYNSFLRMSVGFAIAWNTPFGIPVDFSIAYPLNASIADRKKVVLFTVGN
jgi:outer membrane protein insertion porin family